MGFNTYLLRLRSEPHGERYQVSEAETCMVSNIQNGCSTNNQCCIGVSSVLCVKYADPSLLRFPGTPVRHSGSIRTLDVTAVTLEHLYRRENMATCGSSRQISRRVKSADDSVCDPYAVVPSQME